MRATREQLNFAVPCEIRSFSEEARRAILMEIVDMDARDTLEDEREPVINWWVCARGTTPECSTYTNMHLLSEPAHACHNTCTALQACSRLFP